MQTPVTLKFHRDDLAEFETFGEPSLEKALDAAVAFLNEIANPSAPKRWLTLTGISGLGKTYLMRLIAKVYTRKVRDNLHKHALLNFDDHIPDFEAKFVKWRDVSELIKNGNWNAASHLKEPYLLILDDIGDDESGTKMDDITAGKLYDLIDSRLGKWTLLTSNRSLKQISEKERRQASRMIRDGNIALQLTGEDYWIRRMKEGK